MYSYTSLQQYNLFVVNQIHIFLLHKMHTFTRFAEKTRGVANDMPVVIGVVHA